jgi:hypothetical protein
VKIVDRLPYSKKHSTLSFREETVRVKPYQIIIWVSVAPVSLREWNPSTPAFPAILDIGTNHNFIISRSHLIRWAGIQPEFLRALGATRLADKRLATREADIWLYSNLKGRLENRQDMPPFRLNLTEGIIVRPDEEIGRILLPLLGLRALTDNKLVTIIDGARLEVTIRTGRKKWWPW